MRNLQIAAAVSAARCRNERDVSRPEGVNVRHPRAPIAITAPDICSRSA